MDTKTAYYDGNSVPRAQDGREAVGERNCLTDEGRPLGTGLQERVPNHLRRLWTKATVVNAEGKGPEITRSGDRQEEDCKGTTDEMSKPIK
jgi:hypothetical protein